MTIGSILIASDLSARSERAMQRGFRLARGLGAKALLVSVVDDDAPAEIVAAAEARTRAHLDAPAAALAEGVPHEIRVERGDPVPTLLRIAHGGGVDLAVFGRHRSRGAFDGLRPTSVESMVSLCRIPALIAAGPVHGEHARTLAPVAFSAACREAATLARQLAPGAALHLVHMWMAPFEGLSGGPESGLAKAVEAEVSAQAAAWARATEPPLPAVELRHGGLGPGLHRVFAELSPDLVAIGAHARSLSFTGLGGFAAELLRDPPADLLIARGGL